METSHVIRIGVLTSSRADYGIYLPLLNALEEHENFDLKLIVFGTHLSKFHGYTIKNIEESGFKIDIAIPSILTSDDPESIATSYSLTALKFSDYWATKAESFDYVLCLGDRFEMAASVASGIPFDIKFVHLHGGETTLGAIDNIYRHSMTLSSIIHFVSTEEYRLRVEDLIGKSNSCFVSGALSLDNLEDMRLLDINSFKNKWGIDLEKPSILTTIHPETIAHEKNAFFAKQSFLALEKMSKDRQIIITMPNADTSGTVYREMFQKLKKESSNIYLIENFGTQSYFTCMKYVDFLFGNTSSGIIEAASFHKYVINVGDRQKGRLKGENVYDCDFNANNLLKMSIEIGKKGNYSGDNLYYAGGARKKIIEILLGLFSQDLNK